MTSRSRTRPSFCASEYFVFAYRQSSLIEQVGKQSRQQHGPSSLRGVHFTDCARLIGIFEKRTIWAQLATSRSEADR